jgi:hypothetical protein
MTSDTIKKIPHGIQIEFWKILFENTKFNQQIVHFWMVLNHDTSHNNFFLPCAILIECGLKYLLNKHLVGNRVG